MTHVSLHNNTGRAVITARPAALGDF